jgi:hypothetical protein
MSSSPTTTPDQALQLLANFKQQPLDQTAQAFIQKTLTKANATETYKQAFIVLCQAYEERLQQASIAAFGLNEGQAKKILYKKDRVRLFKKHGIDFNALESAEAANTLSLVVNALHYEGIVTEALANKFPYWKEGFNMVQLDKAYNKLAPQCIAHDAALLDALIDFVSVKSALNSAND